MTERCIQRALWRIFKSHKYRLLNVYVFSNESDWISWMASGYCIDIEIKVSRSDYLADFKKTETQILKSLHKRSCISDIK